jgi:COMPASS component SWD3
LKTYQGHQNQKYSLNATFGTYGVLPDSSNGTRKDQIVEQSRKWAFVICGSEDGTVMLWDVNSKEVLQTLQGHDGVVLGVDVGLEDQTIATCGIDGTIKIWKRCPLPEQLSDDRDLEATVADVPRAPDEDTRMKDADT